MDKRGGKGKEWRWGRLVSQVLMCYGDWIWGLLLFGLRVLYCALGVGFWTAWYLLSS